MIGVFPTTAGEFDLQRNTTTGHLVADESLRTTVLLLLLTEARAQPEDIRSGEPRGGYWGNSYPDVPGWELGSRLHILTHGKASAETARLIEQEIRTRLACLIEDGIAASLDVDVVRDGDRWTALVGIYRDTGRVEWITLWETT